MGKRAVLYARYSTRMQEDSYSLEAQLKECRKLAEDRGWTVVNTYIDEGESAKSTNRPAFQQMLRDAKFNNFDVIIVHKLDRFSRSLIDVLLTARDLKERGVSFVSVTEQFDFTTPQGWIMMVLMAMLAEWFLKNLKTEIVKGKKARAEAGLYNSSQLPPGYSADWGKDGGDGIPIPDENADAVKIAFEMYATGQYSYMDIAQQLNEQGYRNKDFGKEVLWNKDVIYRMLSHRFYLGEVNYKDRWYEGVHEPIIDEALFDRVQDVKKKRVQKVGVTANRNKRTTYILTGTVVCSKCGRSMHGTASSSTYKDRTYRNEYYGCTGYLTDKTCNQRLVKVTKVEPVVIDYLLTMRIPDNWQERMREFIQEETQPNGAEEVKKEKIRLEGILQRLKDMYEMGDVERGEYIKKRDHYQFQLDALKPKARPDLEAAVELFSDIEGNWNAANKEEQSQIINLVFEEIVLDNEEGVVNIKVKEDFERLFVV